MKKLLVLVSVVVVVLVVHYAGFFQLTSKGFEDKDTLQSQTEFKPDHPIDFPHGMHARHIHCQSCHTSDSKTSRNAEQKVCSDCHSIKATHFTDLESMERFDSLWSLVERINDVEQ